MKSYVFATIAGFAFTFTLWTQLPDRQPAQEATFTPLQTIAPEQVAAPAEQQPATALPSTTHGNTTQSGAATLPQAAQAATPVNVPTVPTTESVPTAQTAPAPQTLTPPSGALLSMANVEATYATYYANRMRLAQESSAATAELNQYTQMRMRLSPQDQWNPSHPVNQAISGIQTRIRQTQSMVSANAQGAFFEMATIVAAIRVGLPVEALRRVQELFMFIAHDSFSTDWSQGVYTQQATATQPDLMMQQTPAASITAPVASPQGTPMVPAPTSYGWTTAI